MNMQDLFRQLFNHPRTLEDLGITEECSKQIISATIDAWRESLQNPLALACVLSAQINAADARRKKQEWSMPLWMTPLPRPYAAQAQAQAVTSSRYTLGGGRKESTWRCQRARAPCWSFKTNNRNVWADRHNLRWDRLAGGGSSTSRRCHAKCTRHGKIMLQVSGLLLVWKTWGIKIGADISQTLMVYMLMVEALITLDGSSFFYMIRITTLQSIIITRCLLCVSNSCGNSLSVAEKHVTFCETPLVFRTSNSRLFPKHQTSNSILFGNTKQVIQDYDTVFDNSIPFRKNDLLRITYFRILRIWKSLFSNPFFSLPIIVILSSTHRIFSRE
jgi:hypothetical protein